MEHSKYQVILSDDFDGEELNKGYWFDFYLPQWSSRFLSRPSYTISNSILRLYIANDQQPWCPRWNENVKVSNLQTGVFSGPVGSPIGQHHFTSGLVVQEEQKKEVKVALQYGTVEFKARCSIAAENVAGFWLIGLEEQRVESAEICLFELKGTNVTPHASIIGYGVHPFGDPAIEDQFYEDEFPIDTTEWNVYAFDWTPKGIDFFINGGLVNSIPQSPGYPMQLMLNLYNIGEDNSESSCFEIDYIKVAQLQQ